jgi:hypothetical protein
MAVIRWCVGRTAGWETRLGEFCERRDGALCVMGEVRFLQTGHLAEVSPKSGGVSRADEIVTIICSATRKRFRPGARDTS